MLTKILDKLIVEDLAGKYVRLVEDFRFVSGVLAFMGLDPNVSVPKGFVLDYESVPIIKGSNKRGGVAHDYLCRKDSNPVVSKFIAALVYLEIMIYAYRHDEETLEEKGIERNVLHYWNVFRACFKCAVVVMAWGYFHKYKVNATLEEIRG